MKCLYYSIIYNIILKNYPFVPLIGTVIVSRYCSAPYLVADLFVLEIGGGELCELCSVFDQSNQGALYSHVYSSEYQNRSKPVFEGAILKTYKWRS